MMEKFSQPSQLNWSVNSAPPQLLPQPLSLFKEEGADWNVRQFWNFLKRRSLVIIGVTGAVMATVSYVTFNQKKEYESSFKLLVEPVKNDQKSVTKLASGDNSNSTEATLDYDSQIQILKSPDLIQRVIEQLRVSYPDLSYGSLVNSLTITHPGQTKIIEVSYESSDPVKTKAVLDKVAQAYLNYSLENRQTKLRQGIIFVEKQLPSLQERVNRLQKELQLFRQKYQFIDPNVSAEQLTLQMKDLAEQRIGVEQKLATARASFISLQGQQGQLAAENNGPIYQDLVKQLRQLDAQIAADRAVFQDNNPSMITLQEKRQYLLPLLQQEAKRSVGVKFAEVTTEIQTLEAQNQQLEQKEQELKQKVEQLPMLSRQYTELQNQLQMATESLNRFLTTRETLQIQIAQTELPWQLIQAPEQPQFPVSPDIPRNLTLGLIASGLLGVGAGFLLEKMDDTYHTVDGLREKIRLPVLGVLPFDRQLHNDGKFLEALRVLYTNIQLLSSDQPIRSLVISSALIGDGKSTIAFYLAQIAVAMGQKVLLVDANLRRPQIHTLANLENQWGLSSLISTNMPVEEVIQPFSATDLSIVTSGPLPPDPSRLFSSEKMKKLMEDFRQKFNLVIYDAPSLIGLADARLLAAHTNGIALVARLDKTDKTDLLQTYESLKTYRTNMLGIIANGDRTNSRHYEMAY